MEVALGESQIGLSCCDVKAIAATYAGDVVAAVVASAWAS